jgi:hypothetical protein
MKNGSKTATVAGTGVVLLLGCALALGQTTTTQKTTSHKKTASKTSVASGKTHSSKGKKGKKTASWKRHGQQKIDPQRAREIQEALIREHYMDGKASGTWDETSQKAMEKFQSDNGWQSKMIPDSRALIKLGLGPDHQHLLNPESAMTTAPAVDPTRSRGDARITPPQK